MTLLHETEIDGVRCFWVETGRPTLAAVLVFRYGAADEPIGESGWQHLLEHMALASRSFPGLDFNGHVGLLDTGFQAHGPSSEVVDFLDHVTAWLAAPQWDGLAHETSVLRAESTARGQSAAAAMLTMRYGAHGPGVVGFSEAGLGRSTSEALARRAARVFGRDNAVLVLDGPPPPGLRLHLPPGDLLPPRPAVPCDQPVPAAYVSDGGLALSGLVRRSIAMRVAHDLLRRRLTERLRNELGAAYVPWSSYEPVDADHAVILGGSDIHPERVAPVADLALMLVRGMARATPAPEEIAQLVAAQVRELEDPYARMQVALRSAYEHLMGRPSLSLDEVIAETRAITPDEVRDGWKSFGSTLLLGVPGEATWAQQLPMLSFPRTAPSKDGERYRSVNWPADRARLSVGSSGVEVSGSGEAHRVPSNEVAALFTYADDRRYVLRRDGYGLMIDGSAWRRGSSAVARLDELVPADLHLPQPAGVVGGSPRIGVLRRWWWGGLGLLGPLSRFDRYTFLVIATVVTGAALCVLLIGQGQSPTVIPTVILTAGIVRALLILADRP